MENTIGSKNMMKQKVNLMMLENAKTVVNYQKDIKFLKINSRLNFFSHQCKYSKKCKVKI